VTYLSNKIFLLLSILTWTMGIALHFFRWLNRMNWLRPEFLEEVAGVDLNPKRTSMRAKNKANGTENAESEHVELG